MSENFGWNGDDAVWGQQCASFVAISARQSMPQRCPESILSPARRLSPNVAIEQLEFNGATFFCRRFSDLDLLAAQIIPRMNVNRAGRSAINDHEKSL